MTAHTLRYYERVGLLQPIGRAQNGHRRYSDEDEAWLHFLHCMRATNMPIREMQRRSILQEHRATIAAQMEALKTAHSLLTHKIENYRAIEERIGVRKLAEPATAVDRETTGDLVHTG
jgi:DNA-binding transcriptional MerR regulator